MLEVLKTRQSMRIHAVAVLVVTVVGLFLGLTAVEWSLIALSIGGVMAARNDEHGY